VDPTCPSNVCAVGRAKGVSSVTRVSTGNFCINAPGLSSEVLPAYTSVEYVKTGTPHAGATAVLSPAAPDCLVGQFQVVTKRLNAESVKNISNVTVSVSSATDAAANNVGFVILIP
jgi:hypothetical protein